MARPLPSAPSEASGPALFGSFLGTMGRSDFPCLSIMGVGPWTSPCALRTDQRQRDAGSPGSRAGYVGTWVGSQTARGSAASRVGEAEDVAFRVLLRRRHPGVSQFRGSIPSPLLPLSTLHVRPHVRPHGRPRMTRGQSGSLHLLCVALASTTPCRFPRRTAGCAKRPPAAFPASPKRFAQAGRIPQRLNVRPRVRFASSLAAALPDGLFAHPA